VSHHDSGILTLIPNIGLLGVYGPAVKIIDFIKHELELKLKGS
jgi:hypothetical protein